MKWNMEMMMMLEEAKRLSRRLILCLRTSHKATILTDETGPFIKFYGERWSWIVSVCQYFSLEFIHMRAIKQQSVYFCGVINSFSFLSQCTLASCKQRFSCVYVILVWLSLSWNHLIIKWWTAWRVHLKYSMWRHYLFAVVGHFPTWQRIFEDIFVIRIVTV